MPQHYTKATVEASCWCTVCGKDTAHRIDDGRRGPCLECMARLEREKESREQAVGNREQPVQQMILFGGLPKP